jgi:hypothetical protein
MAKIWNCIIILAQLKVQIYEDTINAALEATKDIESKSILKDGEKIIAEVVT